MTTNKHKHALPKEAIRQRMEHRASGASGIHSDQNAKRNKGYTATNRQNSRSARKRGAINESME